MNEKVKLPKRLYDALQDYGLPEDGNESLPVFTISDLCDYWRENESSVLGTYIAGGTENQWKLIDALRYGYEAEPEPRWGIKAGKCYMENTTEWSFESIVNTSATLDGFDYFTNKAEADDLVETLGFGEVVDLNKETKADE